MVNLKYAVVERERRYLMSAPPIGPTKRVQISDWYIRGTRLRLREVHGPNGVVRKIGQKIRLDGKATEVACTSLYLDDREWSLLRDLPSDRLTKTRDRWLVDGQGAVVDTFPSGLILAEYDRLDGPDIGLTAPEIVAEVTHDPLFTGVGLAQASLSAIATAVAGYSA